jgi:hypothetical protein
MSRKITGDFGEKMTTNPRESAYLLHLKEAEADFRRQLQSGAFGDLMREAEDIDLDAVTERAPRDMKRIFEEFK